MPACMHAIQQSCHECTSCVHVCHACTIPCFMPCMHSMSMNANTIDTCMYFMIHACTHIMHACQLRKSNRVACCLQLQATLPIKFSSCHVAKPWGKIPPAIFDRVFGLRTLFLLHAKLVLHEQPWLLPWNWNCPWS